VSNDLKFTLRFNAETKSFIGEVKAADGAVDKLGDQAQQTSHQMKTMDTHSAALSTQLNSLKSRALGLAGGFSVLFAASNAKDTLATYQDIRTQITALVGGQEAWAETEQYLKTVSQEHNKVLTDMTGNYARLASLQESGLLTQREVRDIFEGMSNAQSQTGASTTQLEQSMYGLSQALASPIVRAEELNQVVEPLPGLLNKLDTAAGLQAGGFRRLMLAGEVTSNMFKTTLVKALDEYQGAAARTADNINAKENELITSYQNVVTAFETPISDSYTTVLDGLSETLNLVADNADLVSDAIGVTMFAAMGRGTLAVYNQAQAKLNKIAITRQELQATVANTQAELAATQAEIRHLEAMQLSNNQKFRAIGAETTLIARRAQETVATNTLTAAQSRLNIASRAGSVLMAALGGPAGIAMIAAGAIGYFALQNDTAKNKTNQFSESIESLLGQMDKLEAKRLTSGLAERQAALQTIELQIETLSKRKGTNDVDTRNKKLSELRDQESQLRAEVISLEDQIDLLSNKPSTGPSSSEPSAVDTTDVNNQAHKLLETLQRQRTLYGETSEAAKVRYDIESGSLKGINSELAKKLILEAESLDKKKADSDPQDTTAIDAFYAQSEAIKNGLDERLAIQADSDNKEKIQEEFAYQARKDKLNQYYQDALIAAKDNKTQIAAIEAESQSQATNLAAEHNAILLDIERQQLAKREEENRGYWERYLESAEKNLSDFDELSASTMNNFSSGMGNAFESVIFDSENAGDAIQGMAQNMARSVVNALGQMAAQWLAYKVVQMMVGTSTNTAYATSMASKAQAEAMMAGINAFSSTAAIPIVGPAAAPAAMAAALAVTEPMAATVSAFAAGSIVGQAHDGIDRVPAGNEGTWMLKQDEMVMNSEQADSFRWMVNIMQQMRSVISSQTNATSNQSKSNAASIEIINEGSETLAVSRVESQTTTEGEKLKIYLAAAKQQMLDDVRNGGVVSREGESRYGWKRTGL
jgi:tape measure domain-containing protein